MPDSPMPDSPMSDIHIDDFYKDAAKILVQLYSCFPRKTLLFVEDIAGPDDPDEFGIHSARHQACFGAMIWLAESGYITYQEPIRQEALDQACLTHKAFTLLATRATFTPADKGELTSGVPDSVKTLTQSNIHQLREALKTQASCAIGQAVRQLMIQSRHHY